MLNFDSGQIPSKIQAITISVGDMNSGQTGSFGSSGKKEEKSILKKTELRKRKLHKASPEFEPKTSQATPVEAASTQSQSGLKENGIMQAQVQGADLAIQIEIHPVYPIISRKLGEEGEVLLQLILSGEGRLLEATLLKSSGFPKLDEAALTAAQKGVFHFNSALTEKIKKNINIVFRLNE
jgi:TonB family protein